MAPSTQSESNEIVIIGAGLCGMMMALYLSERGFYVSIYEKAAHSNEHFQPTEHATDLNLSIRGCLALSEINLLESVLAKSVATRGRNLSFPNDISLAVPHSNQADDVIYNIARHDLYKILFDATQRDSKIQIHFSHPLIFVDLQQHLYQFASDHGITHKSAPIVLGCDGANSMLRNVLNPNDSDQEGTYYFYKQFNIPNEAAKNILHPEWMYHWMYENSIILGHPNIYHQFTGTLIFKPDRVNYDEPYSRLSSGKVKHQQSNGILLIGDAAHSILPFLGQGVNCAFEDCRLLNETLNLHQNNWELAIKHFVNIRKRDTDAIIDLSAVEYSSFNSDFNTKKELFFEELKVELQQRYPDVFVPHRYLLAFTHLPYAEIKQKKETLNEFLHKIYDNYKTISDIRWELVEKDIKNDRP